jgi:membrane-associated phospholipid phosphatase
MSPSAEEPRPHVSRARSKPDVDQTPRPEKPGRAAQPAGGRSLSRARRAAETAAQTATEKTRAVSEKAHAATEKAHAATEKAQVAAETAATGVRQVQRKAAEETLPRRVALERGRALQQVAIAGAAGFGLIFLIVRLKWSGAFDVAVTRTLQRIRLPATFTLMRLVSWPGFPPQSRVIPPLTSGAMALLGFPLEALFEMAAWGTGLVSTVTKAFMKRPRPTEPEVRVVIAPLGGSSFPSGHVITYMGVYGFLAYLAHTLIRPIPVRRTVVGLLGGLLALVGPSRIYQGHHWATDVIASYLLGLSYLIGLTAVYRRLKRTLSPRVSERAGAQLPGRARSGSGGQPASGGQMGR